MAPAQLLGPTPVNIETTASPPRGARATARKPAPPRPRRRPGGGRPGGRFQAACACPFGPEPQAQGRKRIRRNTPLEIVGLAQGLRRRGATFRARQRGPPTRAR
eukprot:12663122-Alexandrium_andersonii.AAC.1